MADVARAGGPTYGDVVRIPEFRRLWLGDFASHTSDRMAMVAITLLAYGASASSADVSLIMGAYFLPAVFLSIPGGVAADRYPRRTIMVTAEGLRVIIALLMALLGTDLLLILLVLAFSSLTYFFYPSRQASVPCLVPEDALMPANAMVSANLILGFAVGPPVAGILASMYGVEYVLAVAAVVMASGVVVIASIRSPSICVAARDEAQGGWTSLTEGLGQMRRHPTLWQGFVLVVFVMFAVGAGSVGLVVFGDQHLGMGEEGFSILLASLAVGTLVGAAVVGHVGGSLSRGRLLVVAALMAGAMLMVLSRVDDPVLAMGVMFAVGFAAAMVLVPFTTLLHERLGDAVMGTGFGMLSMGLTTPMLAGIALAGLFIDDRGVLDLFVLLGLLLVVVGVMSLLASSLVRSGR